MFVQVLRQWGKDGFKELENLKRTHGIDDVDVIGEMRMISGLETLGLAGSLSYLLHVKVQRVLSLVFKCF